MKKKINNTLETRTSLTFRGNGTVFFISFFPAGEGSCLVLETTSLDHGDIPKGFVRVLVNGKSL